MFATTPSRELALFAAAFRRSFADVAEVVLASLRHAFIADAGLRDALDASLREEVRALLLEFGPARPAGDAP